MFTKNQIEEIKKKLNLDALKDTDFDLAQDLTGEEYVVLVQNGKNVKIPLKFAGFDGAITVDPSLFTAEVVSVEVTDEPWAEVELTTEGKFEFSFGLPENTGGSGGSGGGGSDTPDEPNDPNDPPTVEPDEPVDTQTVNIFKTSATKPSTPSGGNYNFETHVFTPPSGWGVNDDIETPIWVSTRTFYSDTNINSYWSTPYQIQSNIEGAGVDTSSIEFMFQTTKYGTEDSKPIVPSDQSNWDPKDHDWTDSPTGISETQQGEWVITRLKKEDGTWGLWEGPSLWAKWGSVGQDGDGVEYLYMVNDTGTQPVYDPTPSNWKINTDYQSKTKEYIPTNTSNVSNWFTDNPTGVSEDNEYEWVWIRKFRYYTDPTTGEISETKMWCPFEGPALWAKWGEKGSDGLRVRTFYTETESSSIEPSLEADWTLLQIAQYGWSEVMPVFTGSNAIWATECYITPTGEKSGEFTTPPRLVSSASVEVKVPTTYTSNYYTIGIEGYTPNTPEINTFAPDAYITSTDGTNDYVWIDAPTNGTDTWYQSVATINTVSNKIVKWSPVSIWNGRDGADGEAQPGTYYEVRVAIVSEDLLTVPICQYNVDPNYGLGATYWKKPSEASFTVDAGQRMWETRAQFNAGGTSFADSNGWCTPYPITGEKGPQGEQGPTGPQGPAGTSGVPGVSFEERYCIGTSVAPYSTPDLTNINPGNDWIITVPKPETEDDEFVWCVKGRVKYASNTDTVGTLEGTWSEPFRLSGTNGVGGENIPETLVATLTNPTGTVVVNEDNNVINGLPIETELKVYTANDGEATLSNFTVECLDEDDESLFNITTDTTNCKLTVNAYPSTINPDTVRFRLSATIEGTSTPTYYQIFTINRVSTGDSPIVANLYNDNANIPASYEGEILDPDIENTFEIREGIEYTPLTLTKLYLSDTTGEPLDYTGISLNRNSSNRGDFTLNLTNNAFSGSTNVKYVYITGEATTSKGTTVKRTLGFRLNLVKAGAPGESPIWYEIQPVGSQSIVYNRIKNSFTPSTLVINIVKNYFDNEGNLTQENLNFDGLNTEKLTLKYRIDNGSTEHDDLDSLSLNIEDLVKPPKDLEENIEFILYGSEDSSIKDRETIPLLANGVDGKSYSIEVVDYVDYNNDIFTNVHVIHKDYQGIIKNLSGETNAEKAVTCIIKVIDGNSIITIDSANKWNQYVYGFDLTCRIDGEIVDNYNPGDPILGVDIKNNVQFILKWELSNDTDILWDSNTVEVVAPYGVTKNGQLIYPAGTYSTEETYQCTATKAPYVLDPTDNRFYIYNSVSPWIGEEQPSAYKTPSTHYTNMADSNASYDTILWIPFDMNEAIYSDVGVLNQALIGSAVFYKDYVFSQKGIGGNSNFEDFDKDHPFESTPSKNWNEWELVPSLTISGQQFTIDSETVIHATKRLESIFDAGGISTTASNLGMKINVTGMTANDKLHFVKTGNVPHIDITDNGDYILSTPDESEYAGSYYLKLVSSDTTIESQVTITITSVFYPVTCFNFKTGETWLGKNQLVISEDGQISFNHTNAKFNPDGSGSLGNEQIRWGTDGTITIGNFEINDEGLYYNNDDGSTFEISNSGIRYFFSNNNSGFEISSDGNATFASGRVEFNKDGSGTNGVFSWDKDGNIYNSSLTSTYIVTDDNIGEDEDGNGLISVDLNPNSTKYIIYRTGVTDTTLDLPIRNYLDVLENDSYYASIIFINKQLFNLNLNIAVGYDKYNSTNSGIKQTVNLGLNQAVKIDYFVDSDGNPTLYAGIYNY